MNIAVKNELLRDAEVLLSRISVACQKLPPLEDQEFYVAASYQDGKNGTVYYVARASRHCCYKYAPSQGCKDILGWSNAAQKLMAELSMERVSVNNEICLSIVNDPTKHPKVLWARIITNPYNFIYVDTRDLWLDINSFQKVE